MDRRVTTALQLLGALAGFAALATLSGGAVLWIRFDALRLPADQAIALLPKQLLLIVGLHVLVLPVAIATAAAALLVLLLYRDARTWFWFAFGLVVLAALVTVVALLPPPLDAPLGWLATAAVLIVSGLLLTLAIVSGQKRALAAALLTAFAVGGATLAVVRTHADPRLEPVALLLDGRPSSIAGFYVGQTADSVYVAPLPGRGAADDPFADAPVDRIAEIRRSRVLALVLRAPTGLGGDDDGREQARALLADLRSATEAPGGGAGAAVQAVDPVATFAPLVSLHRKERSLPTSADELLRHATLVWKQDGCDAVTVRPIDPARLAGAAPYAHHPAARGCGEDPRAPAITAADHTRPFDTKDRPPGLGPREGFAIDVDNAWRTPPAKVERVGPQETLKGAPVYVEQGRDPDTGGLRITYWFFYGLSQPPGPGSVTSHLEHEGDWERISVQLRDDGGDRWTPLSVRFHTHDESRDVPWASVRKVDGDGGTHPFVYSALGSHATYWAAGAYESLPKVGGTPVKLPIFDRASACTDCPQWRTWEQVVDVRTRPWYGFGGAWGKIGDIGGTTGPLGPSRWKIRDPHNSPTATVHRPLTPTPVATGD
ncbi:hypothetical protein Q5424_25635 [Conexibacter sp. JD483]|uniref:hypothetical protein n=1 Tax=unclassified Conexibacter TaxID=2627773 RepID=UPI0027195D9D|nr:MULTISPECIES: hypothetical protein [unclassified Conexibacter]MDO8187616.1 hypothetical protein [Conexibacter sp. CPCC 205706]MDO8201052.1 hypothetical protein [Conexibacter sp. CPCC 205762]MDR9372506.1 hypothetical protein [Conexibacter sp. JD483]